MTVGCVADLPRTVATDPNRKMSTSVRKVDEIGSVDAPFRASETKCRAGWVPGSLGRRI